jgi:serine protease
LNAEKSLQLLARESPAPNWWPFAVSALLLVAVLLTLRSRQRPGYLNLLFSPAFFIPLVLATVGVFFARWAFGGAKGLAAAVVDFASLPIPDWERIVFGRGRLANPLFYSALIPLVGSVFAIGIRGVRQLVAGLAMGFAGFLLYAAWSRAPGLAFLPFHFLALPWLIANAVICLFIARALLKKEIGR